MPQFPSQHNIKAMNITHLCMRKRPMKQTNRSRPFRKTNFVGRERVFFCTDPGVNKPKTSRSCAGTKSNACMTGLRLKKINGVAFKADWTPPKKNSDSKIVWSKSIVTQQKLKLDIQISNKAAEKISTQLWYFRRLSELWCGRGWTYTWWHRPE